MPGTSTVPTIASGATSHTLSITWIDAEDGEYTDTLKVQAGLTDAQIQAVVDTAQAGSNASSYKIVYGAVYEGQSNASSAVENAYQSVDAKVRLSFKDLSNGAYTQGYLPAPLTAIVLPGGIVDNSNAVYTAWRDALIAVIQTGFSALNTGFVNYSKRNDSVSPNA